MNMTYMTCLIYRDVTKMMGDMHQNLAQQEISYQNRLARDLGTNIWHLSIAFQRPTCRGSRRKSMWYPLPSYR